MDNESAGDLPYKNNVDGVFRATVIDNAPALWYENFDEMQFKHWKWMYKKEKSQTQKFTA